MLTSMPLHSSRRGGSVIRMSFAPFGLPRARPVRGPVGSSSAHLSIAARAQRYIRLASYGGCVAINVGPYMYAANTIGPTPGGRIWIDNHGRLKTVMDIAHPAQDWHGMQPVRHGHGHRIGTACSRGVRHLPESSCAGALLGNGRAGPGWPRT
jgi:hypothetical protein